MKSADPDTRARVDQRLSEIRRRTLSSLFVTGPDGVRYVGIDPDSVSMNDTHGTLIVWGNRSPSWGYNNPWQNYVAFPSQPGVIVSALIGPLQIGASAYLYPNQPRMYFTLGIQMSTGVAATADWQVDYTVNGSGLTTIPGSSGTTTLTTPITQDFSYVWPADYWGDLIQIMFKARIRPGTGDGSSSVTITPLRLYGGAQ